MPSPAKTVRTSVRAQEKTEAWVWAVAAGHSSPRLDLVATEEPLEIRLRAAGLARGRRALPVLYRRGQGEGQRTVAVTMRTSIRASNVLCRAERDPPSSRIARSLERSPPSPPWRGAGGGGR